MKEIENNKASRNITFVDTSKLKPFFRHVFDVRDDDQMQELSESIKRNGVIEPIIVRPTNDEEFEYEIVAGHRRTRGAQLVGLTSIPCDIRKLDDATAILTMIDSNLQQRDSILPSEKAWAYKYKLEAIKAQGKRNDLTSVQLAPKLATQILGEQHQESSDTVKRYIRLTHLVAPLLNTVDEKKLAFIPAVELSYLKPEEQEWLHDILCREENFGVPLAQAQKLKGISQNGNLTYEKIDKIIVTRNHEPPKAIKLPYSAFKDFFPPDTTPKEYETTIRNALEEWFQNHPHSKHHGKYTLQR